MKNIRYETSASTDVGYAVYSVYGEDPNCDMGGYHHSPFLGNVEGTFEEVLEYAASKMNGFYQWGAGGYITPYKDLKTNKEPIILNKGRKLKLERKLKLKKLVMADIDMLIENVELMDKESIKNNLIEIKNKLG